MTTFNGPQEDLKFTCGECGDETIQIDVGNPEDGERLLVWLQRHSARGGTYENVPVSKKDLLERISRKAAQVKQLIERLETSEKTEEFQRQVDEGLSELRKLNEVLASLK